MQDPIHLFSLLLPIWWCWWTGGGDGAGVQISNLAPDLFESGGDWLVVVWCRAKTCENVFGKRIFFNSEIIQLPNIWMVEFFNSIHQSLIWIQPKSFHETPWIFQVFFSWIKTDQFHLYIWALVENLVSLLKERFDHAVFGNFLHFCLIDNHHYILVYSQPYL